MEDAHSHISTYSLVCDVTDNGQLYYYTGYFKPVDINSVLARWLPENTNDYIRAAKFAFSEEAEMLAINMNKQQTTFQYHVEEHMYM